MNTLIKEVDSVEITTLQDNYIDLIAHDNTAVIQRAIPLTPELEINNSVLAEHGFSALVTLTANNRSRRLVFDFGFSKHGAAFNVEALNLDLSGVEALVLSHGHPDHIGGLKAICDKIGRSGIELFVHPAAFRQGRCQKITEEFSVRFPSFTRQQVQNAGATVVESDKHRVLLDGLALFLGEIPRQTPFEKVGSGFRYDDGGRDKPDLLEDDTALAFLLKGKGLVILTGCAHSGIINTIHHAQKVTGVDQVYVVMGGYHLSGADIEQVVSPTVQALRDLLPQYVAPTHCTGRAAADCVQKAMPYQFLLNMSGTRMTFLS
jgi:7,8-dihydropterin-6-yl-methyl-4-(beta-D-ribofuranosyl)aminobenzene 5'-phosphate synthase